MSQTKVGVLFAVITAVCWAILAIMLKHAVNLAHPATIAAFRLTAAFLVLVIYFAIRKPQQNRILLKPPFWLIIAGFFLGFNYYGFTHGLELTSASYAQVMIQTGPWFLIILGLVWFKEKLNAKQWFGMILALLGFIFFYKDQFNLSLNHLDKYFSGTMWILGAALTWALYAAIQKNYMKSYTPSQLNIVLYLAAAVLLFPMTDVNELLKLTLQEGLLFIGLALNTLVAYGSFSEALQRIPAYLVSLIIAVNPLLTILIIQANQWFQFSFIPYEPVQWIGAVGAVMVASGVGIAVSQKSSQKT